MNSTIIKRHNERVKEGDMVFFLGDLGFHASEAKKDRGEGCPESSLNLLKQMLGVIYRISGNHDRRSNKTKTPVRKIIISHGGLDILLTHDPINADINYPLNIIGHVHRKFLTRELVEGNKKSLIINVSVELNNYYPYSFREIEKIYYRWKRGLLKCERLDKEEIKRYRAELKAKRKEQRGLTNNKINKVVSS